ncbi:hypothetical protein RSOLAG22IIIB_05840 [Rhizoctonia solani]|uniref:Uncharacterized protein n=1 Tax=Rhizoctonia solani TaxID=456999 RepID=A0A0K6G9N9_9AGAM|nr:hypothetical protein RSOLAG22IIIB_05840 [Rhizoctonia solani]
MKLKFLLVISCLLTMMLPFGNHHDQILSLSDVTAPAVNTSITLDSAFSSSTPAPAPTPMPRYSPLVVPVHFTVTIKKPRPSRYDRRRVIITVPEAPQPVFESIIDMYCALGFPPVADADSPYDADSSDRGSSTPEDDLLPATDGSSEPTSASASDETSETAVPSRSTGGIGHYSDDSLWFTPSSSHSSIAQSPEGLLARLPPSGQVYSPQREAWLQGMIHRLQEMQRQGDHHGRVYDGYPELEASLPATPDMGDSTTSAEHTTPSSPTEQGTRLLTSAPASFESGLDSMAEHTPRESLAVGGLSTTVSQDMLYDQLASLVDYESELGDDDAEDEEGRVEMEAEDGSNVSPADDPSNVPLPSSPYVESPSTIVGGIVSEIDELLSMPIIFLCILQRFSVHWRMALLVGYAANASAIKLGTPQPTEASTRPVHMALGNVIAEASSESNISDAATMFYYVR